jgi:hypothetical protein
LLLVTEALGDAQNRMVLLVTTAASGAAWWLLLAAPAIAPVFVCGVDGYGPADGAWGAERLVALSILWDVMTVR